MLRVLLGAFIVAHGLLTAFIWVSPPKATHSWLLGEARPLAVVGHAGGCRPGSCWPGSVSSPIRPGGRSPASVREQWRSC